MWPSKVETKSCELIRVQSSPSVNSFFVLFIFSFCCLFSLSVPSYTTCFNIHRSKSLSFFEIHNRDLTTLSLVSRYRAILSRIIQKTLVWTKICRCCFDSDFVSVAYDLSLSINEAHLTRFPVKRLLARLLFAFMESPEIKAVISFFVISFTRQSYSITRVYDLVFTAYFISKTSFNDFYWDLRRHVSSEPLSFFIRELSASRVSEKINLPIDTDTVSSRANFDVLVKWKEENLQVSEASTLYEKVANQL